MRYKVFWKNICVGVLLVENNLYKYEPVESLDLTKMPLDPAVVQKRDWGPEIPFFKSRLEAAAKFPDLEIGFHTDFYELKRA